MKNFKASRIVFTIDRINLSASAKGGDILAGDAKQKGEVTVSGIEVIIDEPQTVEVSEEIAKLGHKFATLAESNDLAIIPLTKGAPQHVQAEEALAGALSMRPKEASTAEHLRTPGKSSADFMGQMLAIAVSPLSALGLKVPDHDPETGRYRSSRDKG